jgi:hypothetical protein
LAANAHLLMKGDLHFASINFNGGPGSEIINNGTISYFVGGGRISTSLMGTGTVDVSRSHDGSGMLEVNGAVGRVHAPYSATLLPPATIKAMVPGAEPETMKCPTT